MKAIEIQLYPYKEQPEIIKEFFGNQFRKPIESLFPKFDYISEPIIGHGEYCLIQKGNLFGVIKLNGNIIIPPLYIQVIPRSSNQFLLLSTDFKWGLAELKTRYKSTLFYVPCKYDEIGDYSEGYYVVKLNGKYGYAPLINENPIISPEYEEARPFHEGIAAVKKDGLWGYIDKTLTYITPFEYDEVEDFRNGVAVVWKNVIKYQIDFLGNKIHQFPCSSSSDFDCSGKYNEGLFAIINKNTYGFADNYGNIRIPFEYDRPDYYPLGGPQSFFSEGFACVQKGGYWGYIDKRNRVVFPFILDSHQCIVDGFANAHLCGVSKYITIKHFIDYLNGERIPFFTKRPRRKPRFDGYVHPGWSNKELKDAYMASLENDINNEWNID